MSEKRKKGRLRKRLMVRYGVEPPLKMAFARDISAKGVQIATNGVVAPGTTIQVELNFPDRTFTMWAKVVWAKKVPPQLALTVHCGMGVDFLDPDPAWTEYFHKSLGAGD